MKIFILLLCFKSLLFSSTFGYPEHIKPKISMAEAVTHAKIMLKQHKSKQVYYLTSAYILGTEKQDGEGAWNLIFSSSDKSSIGVYIPFITGSNPSITYYPAGYSTKKYDPKIHIAIIYRFKLKEGKLTFVEKGTE